MGYDSPTETHLFKGLYMSTKSERAKQILDSAIIPTDRDTVGKVASELMAKAPESSDPIEIERSMQGEYIDELIKCINDNKNIMNGNFFIVVLTKNEKLMPNVFRNYFYARHTCPTPNYDQSVYMYDAKDEVLSYLWTLPGRDVAHHLKDNALKVHPDERQLLDFVLQFADGSLFRRAKKLNGEEDTSSLLIHN